MSTGAEDYHLTVSRNMLSALELSVEKLLEVITELQTHTEKLTQMIEYGEEDWSGTAYPDSWQLVSDVNVKRNMLLLTNTSDNYSMKYSRDGGTTEGGRITKGSSATFHSSAGVWVRSVSGQPTWDAHEEWAT